MMEKMHVEMGMKGMTLIGDPAIGKRIFSEKGCIRCHSIKGSGGKVGPDLAQLMRSHNAVRMAAILWNHALPMAKKMEELGIQRPTFKGDEMAHLIAYLHSLEVLGNPEEGARVFERKQCIKCHAIGGVGGKIGPDLAKAHPHPPDELVGLMWNHAITMWTMMKALDIPWSVFEVGEMADLLSYILKVQKEKGKEDAEKGVKH